MGNKKKTDDTGLEAKLAEVEEKLAVTEFALQKKKEELDQTLVQLENAVNIAEHAKGEFLSRMSHEFRTPLNAIIGYSEILLEYESENLDSTSKSMNEKVLMSAQVLLKFVNSLLDIARIEAGKLSVTKASFDVERVLLEVIEANRNVASAKKDVIFFECHGSSKTKMMCSDVGKFKQVVENILSNALKFTEGGEIRVDLVFPDGPDFFVRISDTGVGIAKSDLDKVFEMFVQVHDITKTTLAGLGIGLSTVEALVSLMGGRIIAESEVGKGSTFTIRFPKGIDLHAGNIDKGGVLVVDDDSEARELICEILHDSGFKTLEASDVASAEEIFKAYQPEQIICDYILGDGYGTDFVKAVRAVDTDIKIVIYSGVIVSEIKDIAIGAGADDFVQKPYELEDIVEAMKRPKPKSAS